MRSKGPPLAICLFGPLRVTVRGLPLPRVRTHSVEWLLALLALHHGRAVNRSWLAGTLWPESGGSRALQNLRNDLVALRKALGPERNRLQAPAHDALTLDLSGAVVDVVQFDAAIQSDDEAALRGAVELYVGPLLAVCLEEWALTERAARAEQCLAALETLAERVAGRGEHGAAIRYLRQAAAHDPLRDSLVQRLMAHHVAAGDPAAAIRVYRDFRIRLQEELTAAPEEATTRLFREIRAAARPGRRGEGATGRRGYTTPQVRPVPPSPRPPLTPSAPRPVGPSPPPCPLTSLIGREQQVELLQQTLRQARLMTLVGGGGVGKTRLALEVALQAGDELPGRAIWVELGPLADGALLLPSVAAALGLRDDGGDAAALTRRLVARLTEEASLLVLDNCEHLLDAAAAVVRLLLQHCPDLQVLATSRQRLGLPGEIVWRVPSLPVPDEGVGCRVWAGTRAAGDGTDKLGPVPVGSHTLHPTAYTLLACPSVRLFVERAAAAHPGFRLASDAEAAAVGLICRRLDGIPLAIELAAARARVLTPQQIAARLDDRFTLLTGGARGVLPRHQTLRALIDWSYGSLPAAEAALLRRLSVFAGGWTLEAAEAVAALQGTGNRGQGLERPELTHAPYPLSPHDVLDLLDSLVDRSLVLVEAAADGLRYRMLESVREYAREKLDASGEVTAIRDQHRDWYVQRAERSEAEFASPGRGTAWGVCLEAEMDNFRAALAWCQEEADTRPGSDGAAAAFRLAHALFWFCISRGYLSEGLQWLEGALARCDQLPPMRRASALSRAAQLADTRGERDRSIQLRKAARRENQEALAHARHEGDPHTIAWTLLRLADITAQDEDLDAAWSLCLEARPLFAELGDLEGRIGTLEWLGGIALKRGDGRAARPLLEERLSLCRQWGDATRLVHALGGLGHLERDEGRYAQARAFYHESLLLRRRLGDQIALAQSLEDLGVLAGREQQAARAARLLGAAEAFCETFGARPPAADAALYEPTRAEARAALGDAAFAAAWAQGRTLSLDEALEFALGEE